MVDVFLVVALLLLVAGVVGSLLPAVPGAGLSVLGVYLYWWSTDFTTPGLAVLLALTFLGVLTMAVDYFGGAIAARAGGASLVTTGLAAIVGIVLLFVTGPLGMILGIAGTVFAVEYVQHRDARAGGRAAVYATVGFLASTAMQFVLTATMLVAFVVIVVL